ncbi:MAG: asparagine synthetase B family protein [Candidatus Bathyarchaeia archaeon]
MNRTHGRDSHVCGIAGILDKRGVNATPLIRPMLETIKHRGPDGYGLLVGNSTQRARTLEELDYTSQNDRTVGHARLAIVGGPSGAQPLEGCKEGLVVFHNGEIYNHKLLRKELESTHRFETFSDSESIVHLLEDHYNGNLRNALAKTLQRLDGVFAIAALDNNELMIARDVMGVKQLYVAENPSHIAFASERKALWSIGSNSNGDRLPPGHIGILSKNGLKLERFREPPVSNACNAISEAEDAIKKYATALRNAVSKRVDDMEHVGVIFSGGVDSVLLAKLIKDVGTDFTCYCAGTEHSSDLRHARLAASKLGFKLKANSLDTQKVEEYLPTVISTIEDRSFGQVDVALPVYAAVEAAYEDGVRVMLTGQAADELFGGYPWYRVIANKEGYEKLDSYLIDDLLQLYKETLEREDKITMAHSIELRVPYLDSDVVRVATSISAELKLPPRDITDKRIHREAALRLGVPQELAFRVKQAAQHGSGAHMLLEELALKHGFTQASANSMGYSAEKDGPEALGSCWRYGYIYLPEQELRAPDNIQLYLDTIAYENRLTSKGDRLLLDEILSKRTHAA